MRVLGRSNNEHNRDVCGDNEAGRALNIMICLRLTFVLLISEVPVE